MDCEIRRDCTRTTARPGVGGVGRRAFRVSVTAAVVAAGLTLGGCFPTPPPDDEGHASFAREAIPVLLGRRAYGVDEVEAVADIADLLGRKTTVRMLMKDPAYVDHWAEVLVDRLQMQRLFSAGLPAQYEACWGTPTRANPDPAIAAWVRDHGPNDGGAPTPAWNMADLVRSAVVLDDLSPLYRAYLYTLSMRRQGSNNGRRAELVERLMRVYLNRNVTCLRCHNPTFSTSNVEDGSGNIVWRRLWSVPGHPEKALFGNYYDGPGVLARIDPIMRGDVRKPATDPPSFGIRPWGMVDDCASDNRVNPTAVSHQGFRTLGAMDASNPGAGFGSLDGSAHPRLSLWELEASLRQGIADLQDGYERFPSAAPLLPPDQQQYCDVVGVFSSSCVACHSGGSPAAGLDLSADPAAQLVGVDTQSGGSTENKRVVANNAADSELSRRVNAGANPPRMPPGGGLAATEKTLIDSWINGGAVSVPTANCNTSTIPDVAPDEAFAFLTAANAVDGIWTAAMGYPLTIDHGFPRNAAQRDMLWNLTEYTFVANDWSLQSVLTKVLSSRWFARRAPTISREGTAYELPPVLDPWEVESPEVANRPPHRIRNGQGELVNRYRVNTLLRTVASTLGWREPRRFPGGGYPSPLDQNLGQFLAPSVPGFSGVNFQSLLALESEVGLCGKSGHSATADDWIDALVVAIDAHNSAEPDAPITLGEAWSMLKDRLIQDPTIERALPSGLASEPGALTEEQAVIALFNQGLGIPGGLDLNTPTSVLSDTQLTNKLRGGCGVLVKTPQFMVTNVTPRGYSENNMPDPPRLTVCLEGEPCGFWQACGRWRSRLSGMGHYVTCEDRSVRKGRHLVIGPAFPIAIGEFVMTPIDRGPFTPIFVPKGPGPLQPATGLRRGTPGLTTGLAVAGEAIDLKQAPLAAVRERVSALCPAGLCGFLRRPQVQACVDKPSARSCRTLVAPCDPRRPNRADYCGDPPVDIHDAGLLVAWAEGARVAKADGVRMLRDGKWKWIPVRADTRLQAGDLLDIPLRATLVLEVGSTAFGTRGLNTDKVDGIRGHVMAVTGKSAARMLTRPSKKGALSPDQLRVGLDSGRFESGALSKRDWRRVIAYGSRPEGRYTLSVKEIAAINADFDALHFSPESGFAPDGSDLLPGQPEQCKANLSE